MNSSRGKDGTTPKEFFRILLSDEEKSQIASCNPMRSETAHSIGNSKSKSKSDSASGDSFEGLPIIL